MASSSSGPGKPGAAGVVNLRGETYEELLQCKICYEPYTRPKSLSCLHTYCEHCLQRHLDSGAGGRQYKYTDYREISCPICRKKTPLPSPGGVRRLPDNFMLQELQEAAVRVSSLSSSFGKSSLVGHPVCELCRHIRSNSTTTKSNQTPPATSKCLDCGKCLCDSCRQSHASTRVTESHTVCDLDTVEKDISCKVHDDEVVRFYCDTCDTCICVVCTFQEHATHSICAFSEGVKKHRRGVDDLVESCRERMITYQHHLDLIRSCSVAMKEAEDNIRDISQTFVQEIRQRERQMIRELHDAYGDETIDFLQHRDELKENFETLAKTIEMADQVSDKQVEFLLLKKELEEKLEELVDDDDLRPLPENISKRLSFRQGAVDLGRLKELRYNGSSPGSSGSSRRASLSAADTVEAETSTEPIERAEVGVQVESCCTSCSRKVKKRVSFVEPNPVTSVAECGRGSSSRGRPVGRGRRRGSDSDDDDEEEEEEEQAAACHAACQFPPDEHKRIRVTSNQGVAILPNGDLVIIDGDDNRLAILDRRGRFKYTFGSDQLSSDIKVRKLLTYEQAKEEMAINIYTPHGHMLTLGGGANTGDIIISPPVGSQVTTLSRQDLFHH